MSKIGPGQMRTVDANEDENQTERRRRRKGSNLPSNTGGQQGQTRAPSKREKKEGRTGPETEARREQDEGGPPKPETDVFRPPPLRKLTIQITKAHAESLPRTAGLHAITPRLPKGPGSPGSALRATEKENEKRNGRDDTDK